MFNLMLVAHLIGDYLLQFDFIARWKARSILGVIAHGGIVTVVSLVCAALVDPSWWRYALLIGASHTVIDVARARLIRAKNPTWDLILYLLDQIVHVTIIALVVQMSGGSAQAHQDALARWANPKVLAFAIGYLLLLQPGWVLLRFIVRGLWGSEAAPHLGAGEKFEPMLERVLIASLVFGGQYYLVPLVLLPRRLESIRVQGNSVGMMVRLTAHWAETFLSVMLAVGVGLALRMMTGGH